jgi:hypothetical protein
MKKNGKEKNRPAEVLSKDTEEDVLPLWMIPIYLRSEKAYYEDAANETDGLLDYYWQQARSQYTARDEFDNSDFAAQLRRKKLPFPWRFNDIVGWIELEAILQARRIQIGLFLPENRISRRLKSKNFCDPRSCAGVLYRPIDKRRVARKNYSHCA